METKVMTEELAPIHANVPSVKNVHKILPVTPSGCVKPMLTMFFGK